MIRIGVTGIGTIARQYIEFIVSGKIKGELVALNSRSPEKMKHVIENFHLKRVTCYTDYNQMLDSKTIDMVIICTPNQTHVDFAEQAINAGIYPLIEKPIDIDLDKVDQLIQIKNLHKDMICGVLYCNRIATGYQKVKELVDSGAIGTLKRCNWIITNLYRTQAYHKSSSWRGNYSSEGGGVMMTQASHQLDIFLWLCGMPTSVQGFCHTGTNREIEVENEAHIYMEFFNGATGQFTACSHEFPGTNRLELSGDSGQIILENNYELTYTKLDVNEVEFAKKSKEWFGPIPNHSEVIPIEKEEVTKMQINILNDFIDSVEMKRNPVCSIEEARMSLEVILATYLSSWSNKKIILPIKIENYKKELSLQNSFWKMRKKEMENKQVIKQIKGGLVVSCQAVKGEPLESSYIMSKMAYAAMLGGAVGIRANYVEDIKAIKAEVSLPVIGIIKKVTEGSEVYITPTMDEIDALVEIKVEIIATDATKGIRPNGETIEAFFKQIREKYPNQLFMADVATYEEGMKAAELGFDFIGTTLCGYTEDTKGTELPNIGLLEKLVKDSGKMVIAEGGIWSPEALAKVYEVDIHSAVIGSAITRPMEITKHYIKAIQRK